MTTEPAELPAAYRDLQSAYIQALEPVVADVLEWWHRHSDRTIDALLDLPYDAKTAFQRRWFFGPGGHPRVLGVYLTFYRAMEELDDHASVSWQVIDSLLVDELETRAPALFDVVMGIVYKPIGESIFAAARSVRRDRPTPQR